MITCMDCGEEITPANDGIEINGGEFYQCADCHEIEFGERLYACCLYFANKPDLITELAGARD